MVQRLHQSNSYTKRKLLLWRVQKCISLVGEETILSSAGTQTTSFQKGEYRAENGNIRNFGDSNPHGTAIAPKQWLYQKEGAGMESSKMYCSSRCRNSIYQCGVENHPVSFGAL